MAQLEAAIAALLRGGFLASEIDVLHGDAAGERLADATGRTGLARLAMRVVRSIGLPNDETAMKDRYSDALADGRFLAVVLAPTEERRERAAQALRDHGGRFIDFLGRFTIVPMGR